MGSSVGAGAVAAIAFVISNSTESGFTLDPGDTLNAAPPKSMPAKLTQVLWQRFQAGAAPLVLLPCELIERNADKLAFGRPPRQRIGYARGVRCLGPRPLSLAV